MEVYDHASRNRYPGIHHFDQGVVEIGKGFKVVSIGGSNETPWACEREYTEEHFAEALANLTGQIERMDTCIFNVHVPPSDTPLDLRPKLDSNLNIVMDMGKPVQVHGGSTALRRAIEEHQPVMSLHGHMHDCRGTARIGNTTAVNPGSVYSEGYVQGALISLSEGNVEDVQFTQG